MSLDWAAGAYTFCHQIHSLKVTLLFNSDTSTPFLHPLRPRVKLYLASLSSRTTACAGILTKAKPTPHIARHLCHANEIQLHVHVVRNKAFAVTQFSHHHKYNSWNIPHRYNGQDKPVRYLRTHVTPHIELTKASVQHRYKACRSPRTVARIPKLLITE